MQGFLNENVEEGWVEKVMHTKDLLLRGKEASEQINILGDDGVPLSYHDKYWKSELIDKIILQQDGFDKVDQSTPMKRQRYMLDLVLDICDYDFSYDGFEEVMPFFIKIVNLAKQMNYSEFESPDFKKFQDEMMSLVEDRRVK